jgi:leader peptidase (prepilin peptidase)/N-methyltransferase
MSTSNAILGALMVAILIPVAWIDLRKRIIPNAITAPAAAVAIVAGTVLNPSQEWGRLLAGVLAGGFLLIAALIKPGAMGMGDVKLLGVMGLFLGAPVTVALFIALIASVLTGVVLATQKGVRAARKTTIPFGPYLAFGGIIAAAFGHQLIHAWLSH